MKTEFIEVSPKTGLIIGFAMLIAGALFIGWKFNRLSTEVNSLRWDQTLATIESSNFYTTNDKISNSSSASTTYHGDLTYRYSVNGHEFVGTQYDATGNMHTGIESEATELKNHINSNSKITVFVNPDDPSQSLLKHGISEDSSVRIVFSLFLATVGSIVLFYQWKRYKKQQTEQVAASDR